MSTEPAPLPIPSNIARIAGPLVLGYLFNWALFGALSVQVYNYHVSFPNDRPMAKAVVYGVYLIELSQTIIVARDCFASYATGFGDFGALISMQTIWLSAPISIGLVGCIVQLYYAYRVYVLSQSKILVSMIGACSLFQFGGAIAQGVQAHRIGNLAELADKAYLTLSMWLAGSATCDVLITVSMAWLLIRRGNQFAATHTIIVRLVQLIIETGIITATAAIVDLILLLAFPNDNFHAAVTFVLAKLYSNSLLVLFNNRAQMQRGGVHSISLNTSVLHSSTRSTNTRVGPGMALPASGIHVQRMTFVDADDIPMEAQSSKKARSFAELDSVA